jgi:restriction endonuclease
MQDSVMILKTRKGQITMLLFYLSVLDTPEEKNKLSYYYEKYSLLLAKIAMGYVHSHSLAEDAVHNTFLTIIKNKEKILSLIEGEIPNEELLKMAQSL